MRRIIAFDGIDCIGKSYIIHFLHDELLRHDFIPYVFHLSGPNKEYSSFFTPDKFGKLDNEMTDSLIQWEKFIQLYSDIKTILCASTRNVVILDRTPYSENIWNRFFYRKNKFENDKIMLHFLKMFELLNEEISFINLDVDSKILSNRILTREEDYKNYTRAFDMLFSHHHGHHGHHHGHHGHHSHEHRYPEHPHFPRSKPGLNPYDVCPKDDDFFNPYFGPHGGWMDTDNDLGKIMYMVNFLKEEFNKLFVLLRKYNIDVITYTNNSKSDVQTIIMNILKELFN